MKAHPEPPALCPVCGTSVPRTASACPGCGADERTGWSEDATAGDGLNLPDEEFDYDAFVAREFHGRDRRSSRNTAWGVVAVVALLAFLVFICRAFF